MITVLFDGKCGMCRREIRFYKKIAPVGRFSWVDVMAPDVDLKAFMVERRAALLAIHVFDDNGACLTGADAFAAIWKAIPGFSWLGHAVSLPIIKPLVRWAYGAFGDVRFRLHGYDRCQF